MSFSKIPDANSPAFDAGFQQHHASLDAGEAEAGVPINIRSENFEASLPTDRHISFHHDDKPIEKVSSSSLEELMAAAEAKADEAQQLLELFTSFLDRGIRDSNALYFSISHQGAIITQPQQPTHQQNRVVWERFTEAIEASYGTIAARQFLPQGNSAPLESRHVQRILDQCNEALAGFVNRMDALSIPETEMPGALLLSHRVQVQYEQLHPEAKRYCEEFQKASWQLLKLPPDALKAGVLFETYKLGPAVTHAAMHAGGAIAAKSALAATAVSLGALGLGVVTAMVAGYAVGTAATYWDQKVNALVDGPTPPVDDALALGAQFANEIALHKATGDCLGAHPGEQIAGAALSHVANVTNLPGPLVINFPLNLAGFFLSRAALHSGSNPHEAIRSGWRMANSVVSFVRPSPQQPTRQPHPREAIQEGVGNERVILKNVMRLATLTKFTVLLASSQVERPFIMSSLQTKMIMEENYGDMLDDLASSFKSNSHADYRPGLRSSREELSFENVLKDISTHYCLLKNQPPDRASAGDQGEHENFHQERLSELKTLYCALKQYEDRPEMEQRITRIACEAYNRILDATARGADPTGASSGLYSTNLYPYAWNISYTVPELP
ncbi:MAG: hypothetical protein ACOYK6_07275 [Chthoniobacterales bacterium]